MDHGWPSGKAMLSASRSRTARDSTERESRDPIVSVRLRARWEGKGMLLLALFFHPSTKPVAEDFPLDAWIPSPPSSEDGWKRGGEGGKLLKRVGLKFLEFFIERMMKEE